MASKSLFKKFGTCFIAGLMLTALLLMLGNGGNIPWLPPWLIFSLVGLSMLTAIIFPFIWQHKERRQTIDSTKIYGFLYTFIRYCIAFNIASFGWKKIFGLQFVVPIEISNKPMNQQSGEWLTWFYFGYSVTFGFIVSFIQIGGAYLLLFRKTLLLGLIILFAFMLNLALINIFYQMNAGALVQSVLLTIGILFLILLDHDRLITFFLKTQSNLPAFSIKNLLRKNVLRVAVIVVSLLFTIYLKTLIR